MILINVTKDTPITIGGDRLIEGTKAAVAVNGRDINAQAIEVYLDCYLSKQSALSNDCRKNSPLRFDQIKRRYSVDVQQQVVTNESEYKQYIADLRRYQGLKRNYDDAIEGGADKSKLQEPKPPDEVQRVTEVRTPFADVKIPKSIIKGHNQARYLYHFAALQAIIADVPELEPYLSIDL